MRNEITGSSPDDPVGLKSYFGKTKTAKFDVYRTGNRVKRYSKTFHGSYTEALAALRQFKDEVNAEPKAAPTTLEDYVMVYGPSMNAGREKSTVRSNLVALKRILPFFGSKNITSFTKFDVDQFINHLKEMKYKPPTINFTLRLLRKILNHAKESNGIAVPINKKHMQREDRLRNELTPAQEEAFLGAFDDEAGFRAYLSRNHNTGGVKPEGDAAMALFMRFQHAKPLFLCGFRSGLRQHDLMDLRWTSVKFDEGFLRVRMYKTKFEATPAIPDDLAVVLSGLRRLSLVSEFCFLTPDAQPYSLSTVNRYFRIAKEIAGIKKPFRFNDIRHTYASRLASDSRISPFQIRDALGHTSLKMTERYIGPTLESIRAVKAVFATRPTPDNRRVETFVETSAVQVSQPN